MKTGAATIGRYARRAAGAILVIAAGLSVTLAIAAHTRAVPARPEPVHPASRHASARPMPPAPARAAAGYVVRHVLTIPTPFVAGQYYWDETGAPAGPILVTVDLAARTLSIFRAGYEIGTAVVITGADRKPTPLGTFPVTQKDAHHVSNIYNAPMPYMLRLTDGGVSIHGSKIASDNNYVTHGCIGVPIPFAKLLFGQVKLGDPVVVTRGRMMAVAARSS